MQLDLSEDVVKGEKPGEVTFTYSVQWRETDTPYEKRMDKYRRYQFLPQHLEARPVTPCLPHTACPAIVVTVTLELDSSLGRLPHCPVPSGSYSCRKALHSVLGSWKGEIRQYMAVAQIHPFSTIES